MFRNCPVLPVQRSNSWPRIRLYDGLDAAFDNIVPLSRTMREEMQKLKDWAKNRARLANTPEDQPKGQRKLRNVKKA